MKGVRFVVTLALLAVPIGGAQAQPAGSDFPNRPLRYIVPFPPGGATDIFARAERAKWAKLVKDVGIKPQ